MSGGTLFSEDELPPPASQDGGPPQDADPSAPLAARMRPRTLAEFVGQEQIVGPGTVLRQAIERDTIPSCIFWGPPGCGKSTLAALVARSTKADFASFSAVMAGVAEVRQAIARAKQLRRVSRRKTILFLDEIHRFNKAQQDALLPHVEDGTIVLIGATTENPYFSVNTPLLSRSRVFRFEPLSDEAVRTLLHRAVADPERGLGPDVELAPDAEAHLVQVANGDVRIALTALETAAAAVSADAAGRRLIELNAAEDAIQQRVLAYDREGDQHYDIVSAFIKSMRGSDPDAAVYWLHRMLAAGEDPRYLCRRMVIHAAEDVGMADPQALVVATAAAHALELVGLPEAQIPMTEAAIYIATAPKSNAVVDAIGRAQEALRAAPPAPVPVHLRDASYRGAAQLGHGAGYRYPHDDPRGYVEQEYLPPGVGKRPFYRPTNHGFEEQISARLQTLRGERDEDRRDRHPPSSPAEAEPARPGSEPGSGPSWKNPLP